MKTIAISLLLLLSSFSLNAGDSSEAIDFAKAALPGKLRKIIKSGISRNLVRSRLGRPSEKADTFDSYKIQSKVMNLRLTYNGNKKLMALNFQYVGASQRNSRLSYDKALEMLSHLSPRVAEEAGAKRISAKSIGLVATFNLETNKLISLDLVNL